MAREFILQSNVLTDNILFVAEKGRIFKGGYIAILHEWSFETAWSDKLSVKKFRSFERLKSFLERKYKGNDIDFEGTCIS